MADLSLNETADTLTYTGLGPAAGYSLTIKKDDTVVDVHEVIPAAQTTQTWQAIRDSLAGKL